MWPPWSRASPSRPRARTPASAQAGCCIGLTSRARLVRGETTRASGPEPRAGLNGPRRESRNEVVGVTREQLADEGDPLAHPPGPAAHAQAGVGWSHLEQASVGPIGIDG